MNDPVARFAQDAYIVQPFGADPLVRDVMQLEVAHRLLRAAPNKLGMAALARESGKDETPPLKLAPTLRPERLPVVHVNTRQA